MVKKNERNDCLPVMYNLDDLFFFCRSIQRQLELRERIYVECAGQWNLNEKN